MAVVKVPFVGQGYSLRSVAAAAQTDINLYPELIQDPNERAKNKAFMYGIPGRHSFAAAGGSAGRGVWTGGGRCFIAWDTHYAELLSNGSIINTRTISNASVAGFANSPVQFFPNGNQLFIVAGGLAYIDNGSGPTAITIGDSAGVVNAFGNGVGWVSGDKFASDGTWVGKTITINGSNYTVAGTSNSAFPDPTDMQLYTTGAVVVTSPPSYAYSVLGNPLTAVTGGFLADSFFVNRPNSRAVNFSNVFNGNVWNGLDFISKDSWPDYVRSILVSGSQIYLFGDESFEVWQPNPASTTQFFARIDGASTRLGSVSPWGPITIEGLVYVIGVGSAGQISAYVLDGFTPRRISQHGQEAVWNAANFGPGAISYSEHYEGHTFWVINFGTETWAYDTTTGAWHKRAKGSGFTAWHTAYHSYIPEFGGGKHLTMGPQDATVYETSTAFYDDAGADIKWQKALPHQYNGNTRLYDSRLTLEMETGTAPSGTPTISLDYSDDRGHTFGTAETASIGTTNDFTKRVFWIALGSYYDRVYRITGSSQGRVALIDLELEQEQGTN